MKNLSKYNLKTLGLALTILVSILCLFSYISAPESAGFFESINPISGLMGVMFMLSYFGLSVLVSALILLFILAAVWFVLYRVLLNKKH